MLPQNKPDRIRILFDDHRLVANAGLNRPMKGLERHTRQRVRRLKAVASIVHSAATLTRPRIRNLPAPCCSLIVLIRGTLKKCVNGQAVYPLSEQDGLKAQERRYTAHEEGKH